jgi:predicted amidohydrolase
MAVERIRVASLQYSISPVLSFEHFRDQVESLVKTAADYNCNLLVFPEYFTVQLLTLGNVKGPIRDQIHGLARLVPRFLEMMSELSRRTNLYIAAGTIPALGNDHGLIYNECFFFGPSGDYGIQGKLHMTRFETEEWQISPHSSLRIFETGFGRVAIAICYDVEFPEIARTAARQGASILIVPSCTDDRHGFLRVRYCAHARAIENQMYVIHSSTVGSLPMVPAVSLNYGQAAILTPCDLPFSREGILAEGHYNQEMMIIGELDLKLISDARSSGTVLPLQDSSQTAERLAKVEIALL